MKLKCPNCKKTLKIPRKFAGKKIECPGCQGSIRIPASAAKQKKEKAKQGLDLASLGAIESGGEAVIREHQDKPMTLAEAQAAAAAAEEGPSKPLDPRIRTCPQCGQDARSEDIYIDMICKHCSTPIPGYEMVDKSVKYTDGIADRMATGVSFYAGFTGALGYPSRAIAAILLAAGIAIVAIVVPMLAILAFTSAASLNPISGEDVATSGAWVGRFLMTMFFLEGAYFGAVAYYAAIDAIRATTAGNEQPPDLTWNIVNLGAALGGYAAMIALYAIIVMALAGGLPTTQEHFDQLAQPLNLAVLGILTFGVPMNMIGLASSHAMDGLNPVRVARSIGRLFGHYLFLFLIVLIYLGLNFGVMFAIMSWAGPAIQDAAQKGMEAGLVRVLGGIGAWGVVVGAGFYFAYCIGRVLGLFCRTYREQIDFEM